MAEPESPLSIVEEWSRKLSDFSRQSEDVLFPLFTKTFDTLTFFLELNVNPKRIQRALTSLEFERNLMMGDDEERGDDVRDAIYGLVQAIYLTLQKLKEIPNMINSPLSIVEEWKRKTRELSRHSEDLIFPLLTKTFETLIFFLEPNPNSKKIQRALTFLEFERNLLMRDDEERDDTIRDAVYGLVHSLYLTLLKLTEIKDQPTSIEDNLSLFNEGTVVPSSHSIDISTTVQSGVTIDEVSMNSATHQIDNSIHAAIIPHKPNIPSLIPKEENLVDPLMTFMNGLSHDAKSEAHNDDANWNENSSNDGLEDHSDNPSDDVNVDFHNENSTEDDTMDDQTVNGDVSATSATRPIDNPSIVPLSDTPQARVDVINEENEEEMTEEVSNQDEDDTDSIMFTDSVHPTDENDLTDGEELSMPVLEREEPFLVEKRNLRAKKATNRGKSYWEMEEDRPPVKKVKKSAKRKMKKPLSNISTKRMKCPECKVYRSTNVSTLYTHFRMKHKVTVRAGIRFRCDCGNESSSHLKSKSGEHLQCERGCKVNSQIQIRDHAKICDGVKFTVVTN